MPAAASTYLLLYSRTYCTYLVLEYLLVYALQPLPDDLDKRTSSEGLLQYQWPRAR